MGSEQAIADGERPVRHLLTVDDFIVLERAGAFKGLGDVELVEGEIFVLSPVHEPHARVVATLITEMTLGLRKSGIDLEVLSPVSSHVDATSLPQPDIVVIAGSGEGFATPARMRLVIEVASSTLRYDLGKKAALYARAEVPEYWVADVKGRRIIQMHSPVGSSYSETREYMFGCQVPSATIDGLTVDTSRLA